MNEKIYKSSEVAKKLKTTYALCNTENYGIYAPIVDGKIVDVNTNDITPSTWESHYNSVLNLFKDGIEWDEIQEGMVNICFADGVHIKLTITDYLINLMMWDMLIKTEGLIYSYHIFFDNEITKDSIKNYIDKFLIDTHRKTFSNLELNNIIDDTLYRFHDIDQFAYFLANTVNLEDNVFLMNNNSEFYTCMYADLSGVPIEDIKSVGMHYANKAIDLMKNSKDILGYDHCLADACRASEGINPKQFKEFTINIGTKPDGHGGVFDHPIYKSFINGGVSDPLDYFIESSTGRTAQIIKYNNVGSSGHFARLLGLNNMDSRLHHDPTYDCCTDNFVMITIKDKKALQMLNNRYYRLNPRGYEYIIKADKDTHLIGKTICLRSPITCASAARGQGYCYKCYGDLAYTVFDADINFGVNIGRIASECLSSGLTQKLLSAKHLLETFIEKISWSDKFQELFEIEGNLIRVNSELTDGKDYRLIFDPDLIEYENEEDDDISFVEDEDSNETRSIYNQYVCEFDVAYKDEIYHISNDKNAKLYISSELNNAIKRKGEPIDGKVFIDFPDLKDNTVFTILIQNNELSKTLERLENLLNKNSTIKGMDINTLLQSIIDTAIEGGIKIASTHLEIILSNQVRDSDDILERPKWYQTNPGYEILSLNRALTCNPSITVSMSYQKVSKLLYNPLSFKKHKSSFMDLFFMEQPQYAIEGIDKPENEKIERVPGELIDPMIFFDDPNKVTGLPNQDIDNDFDDSDD